MSLKDELVALKTKNAIPEKLKARIVAKLKDAGGRGQLIITNEELTYQRAYLKEEIRQWILQEGLEVKDHMVRDFTGEYGYGGLEVTW